MATRNSRLALKRLKEQVIVITGASSGIGLVTAREAARRGARLVLMARNEEALDKVCAEALSYGIEAIAVAGDVAREEDVRRTAERAIERFGGFDTWFNNAGVTIYGLLAEISIEDQRRLFDTNFWGVVHGSRVAVEVLRKRGGALINMGSVTSDRAIPLQGIYSASKHAIKGYTDALRMELKHEGAPVSVTLIKPSSIDTPYCKHAKNYMPFEPRNPPPLYAPDVVSDAVLHCAEHPRRDITVGAGGLLVTIAGNGAARSADEIMEETMFEMQTTDTPRGSDASNLYTPSVDLEERGAGDRVAESSAYTRAMLACDPTDRVANTVGKITRTLYGAARHRSGKVSPDS